MPRYYEPTTKDGKQYAFDPYTYTHDLAKEILNTRHGMSAWYEVTASKDGDSFTADEKAAHVRKMLTRARDHLETINPFAVNLPELIDKRGFLMIRIAYMPHALPAATPSPEPVNTTTTNANAAHRVGTGEKE